ncbi:YkgJ family cysteine cluster protein [Candidatus Woesearchaeota archaeon]|nr:YkgJ family cysteine cluster protein [Candidatus Woesearchaeota archaeon]
MIPCREVPKEAAHITKSTPLNVVEELADTPCRSHKCTKCCEYGTGTTLPEDLKRIAHHLGITEAELKDKYFDPITKYNTTHSRPKMLKQPYGPCTFLGKDGCTIHEVKPTGCRLSSWNQHGEQLNEWFDLNYFVDVNDAESVRQWAQRLKFSSTIPGGQLHELVPDKEKLKKMLKGEE